MTPTIVLTEFQLVIKNEQSAKANDHEFHKISTPKLRKRGRAEKGLSSGNLETSQK